VLACIVYFSFYPPLSGLFFYVSLFNDSDPAGQIISRSMNKVGNWFLKQDLEAVAVCCVKDVAPEICPETRKCTKNLSQDSQILGLQDLPFSVTFNAKASLRNLKI
jgi:hypothetical protein